MSDSLKKHLYFTLKVPVVGKELMKRIFNLSQLNLNQEISTNERTHIYKLFLLKSNIANSTGNFPLSIRIEKLRCPNFLSQSLNKKIVIAVCCIVYVFLYVILCSSFFLLLLFVV